MGVGETNKPGKEKEAKAPSISTTQELPTGSMPLVIQDWSGFQAYSPMPPRGYMASSPQAHPYMWGMQPHMMPPYGTTPHPYVMYPYAHPSMPPGSYPYSPFPMPSPTSMSEAPGTTSVTIEGEARPIDSKQKFPIKRSKGSLGSLNAFITGKNTENTTNPVPPNGLYSKSAESESEGSSEGTDPNSQNESLNKSSGCHDSLEDTSKNGWSRNGQGNNTPTISTSKAIAPASGPSTVPTNLKIGMDYWGAQPLHGKVSTAAIVPNNTRDAVPMHLWVQDEKELKKQKRKQSNRESARRSRLRKQAECDELAQRAGALQEENDSLRVKISRAKNEICKLSEENASLKERIALRIEQSHNHEAS